MSRALTSFLHSRAFEVLVAIGIVVMTVVAYNYGDIQMVEGDRGILFRSPNQWFDNPTFSMWVNLFAIMAIAMACNEINKEFNIMRAQTAFWASLFIVIQGAMPTLAAQFYGSTLLCLVVVSVTMLLFDSYGNPSQTRHVFLSFLIIAVTALFQYAALFYLPVLFIGIIQMRIFSIRAMVAAVLGMITPYIVLFGCGFVTFADVDLPEYQGIFSVLTKPEMALAFTTIGLTILLGITAMSINLMKALSYTAKFRAMNGFMLVLMLVTILLLFVDYRNISSYLTLLFFTISYQTAHAFSNHRTPRSYILMLGVIAVYVGIYVMSYFVKSDL